MARIKTYLTGGGTLLCALGIGYFMQYGMNESAPMELPTGDIQVSGITMTSSAGAPTDIIEPLPEVAATPVCDMTFDAMPSAGAMVLLTLEAPCKPGERLTVHHNGLMFTEVTDDAGRLSLSVPALGEKAHFIVSFLDGEGAATSAQVPTIDYYDRVVLQWRGESGLQLHAREFTKDYFGEGHVWAASAGDMTRTVQGEGGFMIRMGHDDSPEALMAEVYSFPVGTTAQSGEIALTVEAEVTDANCDALVEAQTLERRGGTGLRVQDLTLDMPVCETVGDFLVLKNLVEDMTIASN